MVGELGRPVRHAAHPRRECLGSGLQSRRALPELPYGAHPEGSTTQLWVRELRSGATRALTHVNQEIASYSWSADGTHVALVMRESAEGAAEGKDADKNGDKNADKNADKKRPKPIVIDAFQFKADKEGYLTAGWRTHLYLLDVKSGAYSAAGRSAAHRRAPGLLARRQDAGLRRPSGRQRRGRRAAIRSGSWAPRRGPRRSCCSPPIHRTASSWNGVRTAGSSACSSARS